LVVEDNGQGLPAAGPSGSADRISSGHGLGNLEKRLTAVGGGCRIESAPGQGTRVEMRLRAEPQVSPIVVTGQNGCDGTE
ncbi:MAG TPA: ATP-binding protein, partial [Bacillota bacterium]|nr:ATP-binding protein [Bacillota bacterium]